MAKGLFSVYRDPQADLPVARKSSSASHSTKLSQQKLSTSTALRANALKRKENKNPFGNDLEGNCKKTVKVSKGSESKPRLTGSDNASKRQRFDENYVPSLNGVCTGTLRTRTIPEVKNYTMPIPPAKFQQYRDRHTSFASSCSDLDAGSCEDSGYGKSDSCREADSSDMEMVSDDDETLVIRANEFKLTSQDMAFNARAKTLTESPLAEVTEAYTSSGGFSVAEESVSCQIKEDTKTMDGCSESTRQKNLYPLPVGTTRKVKAQPSVRSGLSIKSLRI